jgi:hypothetical protein
VTGKRFEVNVNVIIISRLKEKEKNLPSVATVLFTLGTSNFVIIRREPFNRSIDDFLGRHLRK